mgnify:CR=1 FL=1
MLKQLAKYRNIYIIMTKELAMYFNSPIAYIVIIVFALICGWFFATNVFLAGQVSIDDYLRVVPLIFTFFIPAVTMRLFAEEVRSGTIEILTTLPVNDFEIIIGKYFFVNRPAPLGTNMDDILAGGSFCLKFMGIF